MKHLFRGGRRKVAAVMAVALVASLSQVAPTNAASKANNLVILIGEKDSGWCSQDSPGLDQILMKNAVAETLTILNDQGKIVPYLAKSVKGSADKKTWDITLREGIYFHDGEELTAASVIANVAANLGLTVKGNLPAIAWQDLFGGVTSLAAFSQKVVATGKYSVRFNLPAPRPDVPSMLYSAGRVVLLSSATLKSPNCGLTVAYGTGPFKVKSKGSDQFTTVLEANTKYWRKAADGSSLPKAKTVTFKVVLDGAQRTNALRQGTADMATFGAASGAQINLMKSLKNQITVYAGPRDTTWAAHLNTMAAPFNNKNARLAVSYAIDRNAYVQVMTKGNADPATSFGKSYHPYNVAKSGVSYNLKKAKEYAAAYKKDTGNDLTVVIPITDTAESLKSNTTIGKMLEKAGIKYSLMPPVTSTQYILRGFALRQQWSIFNTTAGRDASFSTLFSTKTDLELAGFRFTNPTLAQCFVDARAAGSTAAFRKCAKVIHDESYWVPIYTEGGFLGVRRGVTGVGTTPLPGGGRRPIVGLSGFDFASVTVNG
jgi:ABC-type transport system substrate-binding protein